MKTLYDMLGVSKQASPAQIEGAYRFAIGALESDSTKLSSEEKLNQTKALKEAYSVLSSPMKREAYDARLGARQQPEYDTPAEDLSFPWIKIALIVIVLGGGFYGYKIHQQKEETARIKFEAEKAKAEAERAAQLAEAEKARVAQEVLREQQRAEEANRRDAAQARYESERINAQLIQAEARAIREKHYEEQQARYERERDEQAARARVREQNAAMERALARPIPRY